MTEYDFTTMLNNGITVVFPPASAEETAAAQSFFRRHNLGCLPEDYLAFLKQSDGLSYNGIELFGILPHPRPEKGYTFPALQRVNSTFLKYDFFAQKIVFGRLSEAILFYNQKTGAYAIADRINLRSRIEVGSLSALMPHLEGFC